MNVQPFLIGDGWIEVRDGNASAQAIFDRHYSRKRYADGRKPALFVGPGEKMVLLTACVRALFVWRKFISGDDQQGVNCAGVSGPVQLTDWKVKAIKIAVILETRGHLTRADFKALSIDPRRWIDGRWLIATGAGLVRGDRCPDFKVQHPKVFEQIKAEADKWMPKTLLDQGEQEN